MSIPVNIHIGIIGSGRMGTDIFYYLSDFDFHITWKCIDEEERSRLVALFNRKTERLLRSGLIIEDDLRRKRGLVHITSEINDLQDCDIIIETIQENVVDKKRLFTDLARVTSERTILLTNTSSIKPSLLVSEDVLKKRFAGLHFFYPVRIKNIIELIRTDFTDDETLATVRNFISSINRFHLEMHEDEAFILNRIFLDFQAQAFLLHYHDGLNIKAIDGIIKKVIFPAGVFEFFDAVGIDVMRQSIINYTGAMAGHDFYRPLIECLDDMISQGKLGRKSGEGFYRYPDASADCGLPEDANPDRIVSLLQSVYINSSFRALEKKLWPQDDLEFAIKEYMGIDIGPISLAGTIGHEKIKNILQQYYDKTGFDAYRPSLLL